MIRIETRQTEVRLRDTLSGTAVWNSDGGKEPRKISVALRWVLSGKGERRETVVDEEVASDIGSRALVSIPFSFEIPFESPLSYDGTLFSISWEIFVRVDLPFAVDETEARPVVVGPAIWRVEDFEAYAEGNDDLDGDDVEDDEDVPAGDAAG
jgi:hypothetical protein